MLEEPKVGVARVLLVRMVIWEVEMGRAWPCRPWRGTDRELLGSDSY